MRLDSWKAIADYLGRDVATVRRWERLHSLPVRRIAGRGRSVFAYVSEIDEWLRAMPPAEVTASAQLPTAPAEITTAGSGTRTAWRWPLAAAALLIASGLFWSIPLLTSEQPPHRAEITSDGIVAIDKSGKELWRYPFSPDELARRPSYAEVRTLSGSEPAVLAATSYYEQRAAKSVRGGELLWLTPKGALSRTFSFDDSALIGGEVYTKPWAISDFRVQEGDGGRRIAVSAHHERWWPSVVTVLDEQWRRVGTFVNQGWVDQVHWLSPDRLLISGFANDREGGMVGILNARQLEGQSPPATIPKFLCSTCAGGSPLRYVVMPRSEVNQASGSTLNGAIVQVQGDRILVRTIEISRIADSVEALYEFSPSLELLRASYGDRYWEAHRALEAEGKIDHPRDRCPYRDGPRGMTVWEQASGWQVLAPQAAVR